MSVISWPECMLAFAMLAVGCGTRTDETRLPQKSQKVCGQGYPSEGRAFEPLRVKSETCDVTIARLFEAEVYRGEPMTPNTYAVLDAASSEYCEMWVRESHGECYLSCRYAVRLNGKLYLHEHTTGVGGPCDEQLNVAMCSDPFELACAIDDIVGATRKCTDVHAGEYYGDWFKPIDEVEPAKPP